MPKHAMSLLRQALRRIELDGSLDSYHSWAWEHVPLRWPHTCSRLKNNSARETDTYREIHGIVMREGKKYALHRLLFFNVWDDRHLFDYELFMEQTAEAKRQAKEFEKTLHGISESAKWRKWKRENNKSSPLWRTRSSAGDSPIRIDRPIWACMHQRELQVRMPPPMGNDVPVFTLTPFAERGFALGQNFAVLPAINPASGEPHLSVRYNKRGMYGQLRFWDPTPMSHPDVVGSDRQILSRMFIEGATDKEARQALPSMPGYEGAEVSTDYRRYFKRVQRMLYDEQPEQVTKQKRSRS